MNDMRAITDEAHDYVFHLPTVSPSGRPVKVNEGERDGIHLVHAQTPDFSEVYFEITSYPGFADHRELITGQQSFLAEHSPEGVVTADGEAQVQGLDASGFRFEGQLQGRYKVRRFLFFDSSRRTYRVIYDPRSEVNEQILESLVIQ